MNRKLVFKRRFAQLKPFAKIGFVIVVVVAVAFVVRSLRGSEASQTQTTNSEPIVIQPPLAQTPIDQTFEFPLLDSEGTEVSKIQYVVETAELRDEIVIRGQKARSVEGRLFLIVSLRITNNYDQGLEINSRDYLRLSINGGAEKHAPSIHNDPVEVQAISTKQTRLGFSVNDTDTNLMLHVGEIKGEKQDIPLTFTK